MLHTSRYITARCGLTLHRFELAMQLKDLRIGYELAKKLEVRLHVLYVAWLHTQRIDSCT